MNRSIESNHIRTHSRDKSVFPATDGQLINSTQLNSTLSIASIIDRLRFLPMPAPRPAVTEDEEKG